MNTKPFFTTLKLLIFLCIVHVYSYEGTQVCTMYATFMREPEDNFGCHTSDTILKFALILKSNVYDVCSRPYHFQTFLFYTSEQNHQAWLLSQTSKNTSLL